MSKRPLNVEVSFNLETHDTPEEVNVAVDMGHTTYQTDRIESVRVYLSNEDCIEVYKNGIVKYWGNHGREKEVILMDPTLVDA